MRYSHIIQSTCARCNIHSPGHNIDQLRHDDTEFLQYPNSVYIHSSTLSYAVVCSISRFVNTPLRNIEHQEMLSSRLAFNLTRASRAVPSIISVRTSGSSQLRQIRQRAFYSDDRLVSNLLRYYSYQLPED